MVSPSCWLITNSLPQTTQDTWNKTNVLVRNCLSLPVCRSLHKNGYVLRSYACRLSKSGKREIIRIFICVLFNDILNYTTLVTDEWWVRSMVGIILRVEYLSSRRKPCPKITLSANSTTWNNLRLNPALRGERPAPNWVIISDLSASKIISGSRMNIKERR